MVGKKALLMNQGRPRHSKISKVFEPIELLIPIVPWPWFVTMTLDTASGILVPAAKKVRPITESGISNVSPIKVIINATTYDMAPIHAMHAAKVRKRRFGFFRQSGIVAQSRKTIGQRNVCTKKHDSGSSFHGDRANSGPVSLSSWLSAVPLSVSFGSPSAKKSRLCLAAGLISGVTSLASSSGDSLLHILMMFWNLRAILSLQDITGRGFKLDY